MKTVLMFPYANHLGGTQPLVAIGSALREAGLDVVFAARGKCRAYVEECGFEVEDVIELDPQKSVAYINKSSLDYHTRASIAEFVEQETALIRKHRAGVVVDLHRPTLALSAMLTKTPRAVLCNTVLTRYYAGEKFLPESHPLSAIVKHLPPSILRPVSAWAEEKLFRSWVRAVQRVPRRPQRRALRVDEGSVRGRCDDPDGRDRIRAFARAAAACACGRPAHARAGRQDSGVVFAARSEQEVDLRLSRLVRRAVHPRRRLSREAARRIERIPGRRSDGWSLRYAAAAPARRTSSSAITFRQASCCRATAPR